MSQQPAIVTDERFATGLTYKEYMEQIKQYKDRFEQYYKTAVISPDDAAFFKKTAQGKNGAVRILALAEDWSSDVYRELPVIARIAEAGGMELRIFPRDANLDIMNIFLNQGKFQSVPTAVFYTKDLQCIAHWIERSVLANEERAKMEAAIRKEIPNLTPEEFRLAAREKREPRYPDWQQTAGDGQGNKAVAGGETQDLGAIPKVIFVLSPLPRIGVRGKLQQGSKRQFYLNCLVNLGELLISP